VQRLTILGSTGSVGQSTLDVLKLHPELFSVASLTANSNVEKMLQQCQQYQPNTVVLVDDRAAQDLQLKLNAMGLTQIKVESGMQKVVQAAKSTDCDAVMSAIVGAAGLLPTLSAVKAGKRVLIANKEPLVMTADLFMREAHASGATILPIDSEHNAIFQCLPFKQNTTDQKSLQQDMSGVRKIHLTASGGPFLGRPWSELRDVTPDQACSHPNWSMGQKISVDSATMMNKGLELIEAAALFGMSADKVNIVVHPQSIIHSMVEYADGSFLAQLGAPDMRIPIAHALSWPKRIKSGATTLDITDIAQLDFLKPDMQNLPCLSLARQAAESGGAAPAVLNAANEVAVDAFLAGKIRFTDIPKPIEAALEKLANESFTDIDGVLKIDNEARAFAATQLDS